MSNDDVQLRDDVQLEVTNHDQSRKHHGRKHGKAAKAEGARPAAEREASDADDGDPPAAQPEDAELEEACEQLAERHENSQNVEQSARTNARTTAPAEAEGDGDEEHLPDLVSIDESAWTAQDPNHLIIDRPHEWPTQDYANDPPPRVDFRQPVPDDISSTS